MKNMRRIRHEGYLVKNQNIIQIISTQVVINSKYFHFFAYLMFYQMMILYRVITISMSSQLAYHSRRALAGKAGRSGWLCWHCFVWCEQLVRSRSERGVEEVVVVVVVVGALWESDPVPATPGTFTSIKLRARHWGLGGHWAGDQLIIMEADLFFMTRLDQGWGRGCQS